MHTIFGHPGDGVSAIAISHDAKYLATIGAGKIQVKETFSLLCPAVTKASELALV